MLHLNLSSKQDDRGTGISVIATYWIAHKLQENGNHYKSDVTEMTLLPYELSFFLLNTIFGWAMIEFRRQH